MSKSFSGSGPFSSMEKPGLGTWDREKLDLFRERIYERYGVDLEILFLADAEELEPKESKEKKFRVNFFRGEMFLGLVRARNVGHLNAFELSALEELVRAYLQPLFDQRALLTASALQTGPFFALLRYQNARRFDQTISVIQEMRGSWARVPFEDVNVTFPRISSIEAPLQPEEGVGQKSPEGLTRTAMTQEEKEEEMEQALNLVELGKDVVLVIEDFARLPKELQRLALIYLRLQEGNSEILASSPFLVVGSLMDLSLGLGTSDFDREDLSLDLKLVEGVDPDQLQWLQEMVQEHQSLLNLESLPTHSWERFQEALLLFLKGL